MRSSVGCEPAHPDQETTVYPSDLQHLSDSVRYAVREFVHRGPDTLEFVGSVVEYGPRSLNATVTATVPGDEYNGASGVIVSTKTFDRLQPAVDFINDRFTPFATIVRAPTEAVV